MKTISFALLTALALQQGIALAEPARFNYPTVELLRKIINERMAQPSEQAVESFAFAQVQPTRGSGSQDADQAVNMYDFRKNLCYKTSAPCLWQPRQAPEPANFAVTQPLAGQQAAWVFDLSTFHILTQLLDARKVRAQRELETEAATSARA